jgi:CheY-like chemotaxis protein/two-component sensor histidine kinase
MSKIEAGKIELHPETVIFGSFMQDLTDMLQIQMTEKKLQFDYELDPAAASAYVRLDRVRLQQVFFNLLSNAIKFTPAGGHIDFLTTVTGQDAQELQLQTLVRDSGIGMSQEFLEHGLFKTFSQENRADGSLYQGTGLGMAITKNLVEMMGGTVSAASAQGQGTTFTVRLTLPLVDADGIKTYQQRQVGLTTSKTVLQGKRILLCEDHPLNREITTRLLQRQGVVVESAANGELGVEMFTRANQGYYDLILMDVRMPVLDGIAATKKIRALPRADAHKIPIVAMTANAYEQDTQACYDAGMNDHLLKPVDVQLLYGMLQKYLA